MIHENLSTDTGEQNNIIFKSTDTGDLHLDVLPPLEPRPEQAAPALLWIGGGGWSQMSRRGGRELAAWVRAQGYALVPVDYRVAPAGEHPACLIDIKSAIRWVRARAAEFHIDPDRIGLWGDSAGGHLALLAACCPDQNSWKDDVAPDVSDAVQIAIGYAPPCDFTREVEPMLEHVERLLGAPPLTATDLAREASPIAHVTAASPPQLLVHGAIDQLVPLAQSQLHLQKLQEAGVACDLVVVPDCGHDSHKLYADVTVQEHVLRFLEQHLAVDTPSPS